VVGRDIFKLLEQREVFSVGEFINFYIVSLEKLQEDLKTHTRILEENERMLATLCADKNKFALDPTLKGNNEKLLLFVGRANALDKILSNINGSLDT